MSRLQEPRNILSVLLLQVLILDSVRYTHADTGNTTTDGNPQTTTPRTGNSTDTGQLEDKRLIRTDDIVECLRTNGSVEQIFAREIDVSFSQPNTSSVEGEGQESRSCLLHVTAPEGSVLYVRLLELTCKGSNFVSVSDPTYAITWTGCESLRELPSDFITSGHVVNVRIVIREDVAPYSLRMSILTMAKPGKPELELRYLQTSGQVTQGYIQTPGLPPNEDREYPPLVDSWVQLTVPAGHVVLLSVVYMALRINSYDRCVEKLELLAGNRSQNNVLWSVCADLTPLPAVHEVDVLHVHFKSSRTLDRSYGFRMLFSFHKRDAAPQQLSSGKWNCSVPNWQDFEMHFSCNLETECQDGEDEAPCPYTDSACGQGRISAGGGCYVLGHPSPDSSLSWNQANMECIRLGGHLASLNTPKELRDVTDVILSLKPMTVFLGLKSSPPSLPKMYKYALLWEDSTIAFFLKQPGVKIHKEPPSCGFAKQGWLVVFYCDSPRQAYYLCEFDRSDAGSGQLAWNGTSEIEIQLSPSESSPVLNISSVECPSGHFTHTFLACDVQSSCWAERGVNSEEAGISSSSSTCTAPLSSLPPDLTCKNGVERVPYSLVCDHRQDCQDASDEDFCVFRPCTGSTPLQCDNQQCVELEQLCDGQEQCVDGADESLCDKLTLYTTATSAPPPAVIHIDGRGSYNFSQFPSNGQCPETHFQCPGDGYCLPVYVRCNGVYDCPGKEDEAVCNSYTCPGLYRCRASRVCLHPQHVCDGVTQCPRQDDELFCGLDCPASCTCHGLAFVCQAVFRAESFPRLRYLDASGSGMSPQDVSTNTMLIHLTLSNCGLTLVGNLSFPNLRSLNLSDNSIQVITAGNIAGMRNLRVLILAGNPLTSLFVKDWTVDLSFLSVELLDVSRVEILDLDPSVFPFPRLQVLNLTDSGVETVASVGFRGFQQLRVLDLRGCPMLQFPWNVFQGLDRLQDVSTDNYKLCCPATLPGGFNLNNCRAPSNEISSCDALLRSDVYRVFLSVFAALALIGNLGSFVVRVFVQKSAMTSGFGVFVTSLCLSDFLMGVYLAIIGIADRVYLGSYLWEDSTWRQSAACQIAGFFSLVSNEVSAFIICLITLDRFLVLRFPLSSLHFRRKSAIITSGAIWLLGLLLATVPVIMGSQWEFYSQTGICLPLPITRNDFPGHDYAFVVMIVLNFVLFLLIAAGQVSIYASIRANQMSASNSSRKSQDLSIARRLITVAVSDFLCWFPIGLLGLMASQGTPIPGEVNVGMAIFVLPLNSALNPFLYTLNTILERRQRAQEERLLKSFMSKESLKLSSTTSTTSDGVPEKSTN